MSTFEELIDYDNYTIQRVDLDKQIRDELDEICPTSRLCMTIGTIQIFGSTGCDHLSPAIVRTSIYRRTQDELSLEMFRAVHLQDLRTLGNIIVRSFGACHVDY